MHNGAEPIDSLTHSVYWYLLELHTCSQLWLLIYPYFYAQWCRANRFFDPLCILISVSSM